jgi:hypothetical protein
MNLGQIFGVASVAPFTVVESGTQSALTSTQSNAFDMTYRHARVREPARRRSNASSAPSPT